MEAALLYLLKANVVLALFAAAYYGLLRRLTFFELNRAFLLLALVFAAVYPALPMPGLLPAEAPVQAGSLPTWALAELSNAALADATQPAASGLDWAATGLLVYGIGAGLLLARLLVQLVALARLRRTARPATTLAGVPYRELPTPGDPFSFGHTIYLHAEQYSAAELVVVLAHEQAHIRQHHTLDVLVAHLGTAAFWVNPAAWLLRRALLDNLEYLADAATLRTGLDRRAYQYCLLQLSRGPASPALALPFSFLTLKNRVAMMNTPLSSSGQLARYVLAGPLVILAALGYSAAHAREAAPVEFAGSDSLRVSVEPTTTSVSASALASPAEAATKSRLATAALPTITRNYLNNNYPQADITDILTGSLTPTGPISYVVGLVYHRQPLFLSFDSNGRLLGKLKSTFKLYKPAANTTLATSAPKPVSSPPAANQATLSGTAQNSSSPLYYLDGQFITEAQYQGLNPADIANIQVLKGEQARQMAGDKASGGIVVITSKANRYKWSVMKFNRRVERIAPLEVTDTTTVYKPHFPTDALYYLDGQPSTLRAIEQVEVKNMATMNVVQDQASLHRLPNAATSNAPVAILITTKANSDAPAVRAFADEADLESAYYLSSVSANVLKPAALAYITSHYPDARITQIREQKRKTTGVVKYQVWLATGKRPFPVYFSLQGEFLGE